MKTIEIENAAIVGITNEQVKMQSGEERQKQTVLFTENTGNGVVLHGCTVWDDNIERLGLQQSGQYKLCCRLVGRQWAGRFSYELVAFKAEQVNKQTECAQEAF